MLGAIFLRQPVSGVFPAAFSASGAFIFLVLVLFFDTGCAQANKPDTDEGNGGAILSGRQQVTGANAGPSGEWGARRIARWNATMGVVGGTVLRVEAAGRSVPGPKLAGYLVLSETERPLSEHALEELVALIRSPDGFDDSVTKRCNPGISVGFRLMRKHAVEQKQQTRTELVVDFGCNRLLIGDAQGDSDAQASYFDPSRAAFVELVQLALPEDRELRSLPY